MKEVQTARMTVREGRIAILGAKIPPGLMTREEIRRILVRLSSHQLAELRRMLEGGLTDSDAIELLDRLTGHKETAELLSRISAKPESGV